MIDRCNILRFARIQLKLQEAEHTCDLLFLTLLKTLRTSLDLAADRKRGVSDIELLCRELEREEKKKEGKEDKKKERKRNQRAKKRESKLAALAAAEAEAVEITVDTMDMERKERQDSGDSGVSSMDSQSDRQEPKDVVKESKVVKKATKQVHDKKVCKEVVTVKDASPRGLPQDLTYKPRLILEEMLEEDFNDADDEDEEFIPEEEIRNFRERSVDIALQRQQLRQNLRERFSLLCRRGVKCVNKRMDKPGCCYV